MRVCEDVGIASVHEDDFKPDVLSVLCKEVAVEHFTVRIMAVNAALCNCLVAEADDFFSPGRPRAPAGAELFPHTAAANAADSDNDEARLCLVAEGMGTVELGGVLNSDQDRLTAPLDQMLPEQAWRQILPGFSELRGE